MEWGDNELLETRNDLPIASLIDVVFLLLIYFMVTSSLKKSEADLGITLPGTVQQSAQIQMPDEQTIEIEPDGRVVINNTVFGADGRKELPDLVTQLRRYKQACDFARTKALVTIQAADKAKHERVIDVMNACAGAGIKHMTFGLGSE